MKNIRTMCGLGLVLAITIAGCDSGGSGAGSSGDSGGDGARDGTSDGTTVRDSSRAGADGAVTRDGAGPGADGSPDGAVRTWRARRVFGPEHGLEGPDGLFAAADGTVLVANEVAGNVLRVDVDAETVQIEVAAGLGLSKPEEVTVGPAGALWVSDDSARVVFRVTDGVVERIVGPADGLESPEGIAVDPDGVLYIGDERTSELLRLVPGGQLEVIADSSDGVFAPEGLTLGRDGTLYATDDRRGGVIAYDQNGPRVFLDAETLGLPEAVAEAPDGTLWFTDNGGDPTLQRFDTAGRHLETIPMPVERGTLAGLCVLTRDKLVVSVFRSRQTHEIWVVER